MLYVAVTRAKDTLLLSGHWWSRTTSKPRGPSVFLDELADACPQAADVWADAPSETSNPLAAEPLVAAWPLDAVGSRKAALLEGAHLVRLAQHFHSAAPPVLDDRSWDRDVRALLADRQRHRMIRAAPALPESLSVSLLVALARNPAATTEQLRRPVPREPAPTARRGTRFHAWLEHHFAGDALLDVDELPGADDRDALPDDRFEELTRAFLDSPWADRVPHEVEVPFSTVLGGRALRGRMDAVFADPDGGWTVVDWKTGRVPPPDELNALAVQLAIYRRAWAALSGAPLASVRAALHFVASGETVVPELPSEAQLVELLREETLLPTGAGRG